MKAIVYSANFGNYDPEPYDVRKLNRENLQFVWFTDNYEFRESTKNDVNYIPFKGWRVEYVNNYIGSDKYKYAKTNRYYKLQPNRIDLANTNNELPDINVYIDSNKQLFDIDKLLEYCQKLYNDPTTDAFFYTHEHRTTVRQELKEITQWKRDDPARIMKQFKEYWDEGFRDNIPLMVASVQIRKTHAPKLQEFLDCWWNEVKNKSYRDQISMPYAIWKTGFTRFKLLDVKTERFNMIKNISHKKVLQV